MIILVKYAKEQIYTQYFVFFITGVISSQASEDSVFESNSQFLESEEGSQESPSNEPPAAAAAASSEVPSEPQNQLQVPSSSKESDVNPEDNEGGEDVLPDGMGESSVPPWLQAVSNKILFVVS